VPEQEPLHAQAYWLRRQSIKVEQVALKSDQRPTYDEYDDELLQALHDDFLAKAAWALELMVGVDREMQRRKK
jgi:hypothetical protein